MTDFCLAVLREETTQLCFKGTIFREGVGGGGGSLRWGENRGAETDKAVQWVWDNGKQIDIR